MSQKHMLDTFFIMKNSSKDQSILFVRYKILQYHSVCLFKEPSVSNIQTGDEGFFVCMSFESLH